MLKTEFIRGEEPKSMVNIYAPTEFQIELPISSLYYNHHKHKNAFRDLQISPLLFSSTP